ncbi:uncharacterized protein LOC130666806 [Microplitis mediator]|uniref:uncharacterized protein LOC130666806 n=1 Tax=Microplitis mediator TaxID=375433 RepID=UPI0025550545|nr:uncharacterized protein LOC130666806 [Microplitis mediator]XP_057324064.1 uncharacterized protein LOC130666806 [Microplitis mediator]
MSSDSDHIRKPCKRIRCLISDSSESSSDESVIARIRRKRRTHMKVVSDDDSSDEDVINPKGKRNRNKALESDSDSYSSYSSGSNYSRGLTSPEWESDWESSSGNESDEEIIAADSPRPKNKKQRRKDDKAQPEVPKSPENVESDESDGTAEKCPICLLSFRHQQIATPSSCDHCFCLLCLTEWSKNINTCPVDRRTFTTINIKTKLDGPVINSIPVQQKNDTVEQVQEDPTYCEVCRQSDREERLLLCDRCDSGYHLECLTPPMDEVPYDEWYCPSCSAHDPHANEPVNNVTSRFNEMMATVRSLGMTYGRREAGLASQYETAALFGLVPQRLVPRTRQTERVRANIRANRSIRTNDDRITPQRVFDPDQPSTSSGFDSISENSRGRSPNSSATRNCPHHSRHTASKSKSKTRPKATSRKKKTPKRKKNDSEPLVQKVIIKEYGTDGEEKEIVSYVKVKNGTTRKCKKRARKSFKRRKNKYHRRACRRIGNIKSVRKRVAIALNMAKKKSANPIGLVSLNNQSSSVPQRTELTNARHHAGIPQLNLFGNNLPLDYYPFGSDDEVNPSVSEEDGISGGNVVSVSRHSASSINAIRRRLALKTRVSRVPTIESQPITTDLLANIISCQELWHSKDTKINLKPDGTLIPEKKNNKTDVVRNNNTLIKEFNQPPSNNNNNNNSIIDPVTENTGSSNINAADIVQAPMYNNSRGGNNSDNAGGGGSFRGNYHNRGHHGHNRNDYGPPRDSYSGNGPPMYGGPGPRDNFGHGDFHQPPPLLDFGHNRRQPHLPGIHRNRNNQHFRNNPGRGRNFNMDRDRDRGGFRPMDNIQHSNFQQPNTFNNNPNISNTNTAVLPSNVSNLSLQDTPDNLTSANIDADVPENTTSENAGSSSVVPDVNLTNELPAAVATEQTPDAEECDLYSDIEMPVKSSDNQEDNDDDKKKKDGEDDNNGDGNSSVEALLPPPIPPSDLLDFEDNMKSDNESDDNDLVIDDTPKDPVITDAKETKTDDIYDPFAVLDSDSNDSNARDVNVKNNNNDEQAESSTNLDSSVNSSILPPLEPPPMPPEFAAIVDMSGDMKDTKKDSLTLLGTYYNDDDDDDNPNNDEDDDDEAKGDCPNFSIYSSETMDVARHAEQELTQQIGPLEPPPMPPIIPDDDDIIVADVQGCDLADIPEPVDPYIESLQKERQTLSKIPTKKLSIDSRGKITFKIGNKSKLNNKLYNLQDQFEDTVSTSMDKDKESKDKELKDKELKDKEVKDKELKEKESKEKELKDKELKEKESKDKELKDKELKEKELNEKESELFLMKKVDDEEIQSDNNDDDDDDDDEAAANQTTESSKEDKEDEEEEEEEVEMVEDEEEEFVLMKCDSPAVKSNKEEDKDGEKMSIDGNEKTVDNSSSKPGSDIQASDAAENVDAVVMEEENISLSKSISDLMEEPEELKLRKDNVESNPEAKSSAENEIWESDGAYTPCKDEMPVKDKSDATNEPTAEVSFDTGLEPITPPPKDRSTDDLGARCPTPIEYAGLGTEAISETDEPINFEEELSQLQRKEKEIEEGEVTDENKVPTSNSKKQDKSSDTDNNTDTRKKKKSKRDRCKEASEKNKENISSDNQVEWKKISKSTKERSYREKSKNYESGDKDKSKEKNKYRDRSKDRAKKHSKDDNDKKKVKRKELPRYDVRKIVSEKPVRPRKDEYGRDIRDLSLSLSPSRSIVRANRRSHSRLSRSYSPRMNLRKSRSWSRGHRPRSRSQNRSSPYKQSLSRSRKKSVTRDRRSLSRRRSRSPPTNRRNQRVSPARQHQLRRSKKKQSLSRKNRSRTRSWSRSRSRSRVRTRSRSRGRSRSRSRVRMRSRSKSRTSSKSPSKTRSRSRGAKKKEKLKKQKSPAASHSRRRKRSRSRSKTPTSKKTPKSRSKRRNKRDSNIAQANTSHSFITRSRSRERSYSHDRNHSRNWNKINDKDIEHSPFDMRGDKDQQVSGNAAVSWSAQWTPSWSRSRSRTPIAINKQRDDHLMQSHNWSPTSSSIGDLIAAQSLNLPPSSPPSQSSMLLASMSNAAGNINGANPSAPTQLDNIVSPKNLTVILRNKDANKNKKKKDKRSKEKKKSRDVDRRKSSSKRNRTPPPSKEVFASGDNILVSVCFNNENTGGQSNNMSMNLTDTLPLLTTAKRRRREPIQPDEPIQPAKKPKKDKSKDKKSRPSPKVNKRDKKRKSKAAEIAATKKPVAVIDLDQSPFREQTLSPQDVIVLSDDDNVGNNDNNNINNSNNGNNGSNEERNNINIMNSSHDNTINTSNNSEHNNISNDNNNGAGGGNNQNNDVYDDDDEDDRDHDEDNGMFMFANQQQDDNNQLGKGDDKAMQQEHQQMKLLQQKRLKLSEHELFMIQGPKTPPEPQVKFSISKQQSNLRSIIMHPLFNRDRDDEMEIEGQLNINTNVSRGKEGQGGQNEIFDENDSVEINNRLMSQDQAADKSMELDQEEMGDDSNKKGDGHQVADDEDGEQDDEEGEDDEEDREDDEEQIKGDGKGMGDEAKKQGDKEKRMDDESDRDKADKKASKSDSKNSEVIDLCKIGPNTPPEPPNSPLTSPDVYDPFDPTKSRSPTPSVIEEPHLPSDQKHANKGSDLNTNSEKQEGDKPKVISMVTIKRALSPEKAAASPAKVLDTRIEANMAIDLLNQNSASAANISCFTTINPVLATVAAAVQRSGMFNLNNPSAGYGITAQRNTAGHINRLSPSSQLKQQRANERVPQLSNLFGNSVKNMTANSRLNKSSTTMDTRNSSSMLTNNGGDVEANDATIDTSSPYSPGSSLSDGIFDPPSPARNHHSPPRLQLPSLSNLSNINKNTSSNNTSASKNNRSMTDKKDIFDSLFDSSPIVKLNSNKLRNINKKSPDKRKKMGNSKIGVRMDENQLQILDDLPSSAVEMQVKDKFLKKLNRQERVVEEVKLVLKPHYTKKHINKDEYKDIMRKAVPKICHNKSGEINPKKIAHLVEAYVKRCRNNKRKSIPEIVTKPSATMTAAATNKNLRLTKTAWS